MSLQIAPGFITLLESLNERYSHNKEANQQLVDRTLNNEWIKTVIDNNKEKFAEHLTNLGINN